MKRMLCWMLALLLLGLVPAAAVAEDAPVPVEKDATVLVDQAGVAVKTFARGGRHVGGKMRKPFTDGGKHPWIYEALVDPSGKGRTKQSRDSKGQDRATQPQNRSGQPPCIASVCKKGKDRDQQSIQQNMHRKRLPFEV